MVSLISFRIRLKERPERVALLEPLLRQPGGATIGDLMAALGERRDIISDDLEAMRDNWACRFAGTPSPGRTASARKWPAESPARTAVILPCSTGRSPWRSIST